MKKKPIILELMPLTPENKNPTPTPQEAAKTGDSSKVEKTESIDQKPDVIKSLHRTYSPSRGHRFFSPRRR